MKNKRIQETIYEFDSDSNVICIYQKQRNKPTGIATFSKDKIILGEYFCEEDTSELEILISNLDPKFILFYCNSDKSIKNIVFNLEKERIIYLKHFSLIYTELVENLKSLISFSFDNEISLNSRVFEILEGLGEGGLQALNSLIIFLKSKNFSSTKLIFEKVEFENIMIVSQRTLRDLLIFDEKLHPSQVKGKGRSKEGLSLYSFFNKAITSQGKRFMKNLFLFPAKNINTINSRLDCISDFYAIQNLGLTKRLIEELKNVNDVEKIVSDLTKFNINYRIWGNLWKTTNSFLSIFEIFNQFPKERFKLLQNLYSKLNSTNIQSMIDLISGCFDFYKEDVKPKLKVGINEDMDKLREDYNILDETLSKFALEYSKLIPNKSFIKKFMFIFIPQLGYMFAVEKNKIYYRLIKRISKQYLLNQENSDKEDNMEEFSHNDEESVKNISITITTTNKKFKESESNFSDGKKTIINSKSKGEMKIMQDNSKRNKSIYFSDIVEQDEEENEQNNMEEDKDEDADEEENCLNNYDETMLLQNICFSNINLDFQFHNESFIYYKNEITKILDETYGDLSARITDLENAIFREISKQILKNEKTLYLFNEFITSLDCFLNLYLISEKFNLTRPIVKTEEDNTSLEIFEGRNLILEYCHLGSYVKNNFNTNNKNIALISGINSSGKSCFLRQIGSIVYLAHIGSFVPAKLARFPLFSKILSLINIEESSIENLSGFTKELNEIKLILNNQNNNKDKKCLVLFDDIYKKTSFKNRLALFSSTLIHLAKISLNKTEEYKIKNGLEFKNKRQKMEKNCESFQMDYENSDNQRNNIFLFTVNTNFKEKITPYIQNYAEAFQFAEFVSDIIKVQDKFSILNTFQIKLVESNNLEIDVNQFFKNSIYISKQNGLNNDLFVKALEILTNINEKQLLQPNYSLVNKYIKFLKTGSLNMKEIDDLKKMYILINGMNTVKDN